MQENGALRDLGRTVLSGKFSPSSKWLSWGLSVHIVAKVICLFYLCCDDLLCGYLGSRGLKGFGMGVESAEEDEMKVESSVMVFSSETYEKWVPSPRQTPLCSPWKNAHGSYHSPSQEQCGVGSSGATSWFQVVSEQREWLDGFNLSNGRWFLAEKGLLLCCPCAQQDLPVCGWNNSAECGSQPVWCLGLSNSDDQHRWLARTLWLMLLTQTTYIGGLAPPSISCSPGKSHGLPGLLKSSYAEGVITLPMFRDCKHSIKQCLKCRWHIISFP